MQLKLEKDAHGKVMRSHLTPVKETVTQVTAPQADHAKLLNIPDWIRSFWLVYPGTKVPEGDPSCHKKCDCKVCLLLSIMDDFAGAPCAMCGGKPDASQYAE